MREKENLKSNNLCWRDIHVRMTSNHYSFVGITMWYLTLKLKDFSVKGTFISRSRKTLVGFMVSLDIHIME